MGWSRANWPGFVAQMEADATGNPGNEAALKLLGIKFFTKITPKDHSRRAVLEQAGADQEIQLSLPEFLALPPSDR